MLSDCLEEIKLSTKVKNSIKSNSMETELKPLCSFTQENQLQTYIGQLENMFNSKEVIYFNYHYILYFFKC